MRLPTQELVMELNKEINVVRPKSKRSSHRDRRYSLLLPAVEIAT